MDRCLCIRHFGYINNSSSSVTIPVDPNAAKNMFTTNPKDCGQPTVFRY
jgi:hypothetical protein